MTTLIDDIITTDITAKLNAINGVSVLEGYMVHYANDLINGTGGKSFPAVAIQPESDEINWKSDSPKALITHNLKLIGAVSSVDRTLVSSQLNELVKKVRTALFIPKWNDGTNSKAIEITTGGVVFNLPDSKDQYAFFEMSVNIRYVVTHS